MEIVAVVCVRRRGVVVVVERAPEEAFVSASAPVEVHLAGINLAAVANFDGFVPTNLPIKPDAIFFLGEI
jgi:hypothetical protein